MADDSLFHRELAVTLLRREKYRVAAVQSGAEALAAVRDEAPDMILLDLMLPDLDVLELCRKLKADPATRPIPVILTTALDRRHDKVRGLEAGADDFLIKPYSQAELAARVRSLVRAKQMQDALEAQYRQIAHKSRVMEHELRVAREVQQRLLPRELPPVDGLWWTATYQPSHQVGGDFYDFRLFPGGKVGLFIADVEGHGAPAALITALIKVIFHNATQEYRDPGWVMGEMNRQLIGLLSQSGVSPGVTALYAVIDLPKKRLRLARAGHPPVAVRPASGEVELLEAKGFPLGWFEEAEWVTEERPLRPGDLLLLYTDGLFEILGSRDGSGLTYLQSFLRGAPSGWALVQQARDMLARTTGGRQIDDIALIALELEPLPQGVAI